MSVYAGIRSSVHSSIYSIYTCISIHLLQICIYIHIHTRCICICVHIRVCVYIYIYIFIYVCIYAYMYMRIYSIHNCTCLIHAYMVGAYWRFEARRKGCRFLYKLVLGDMGFIHMGRLTTCMKFWYVLKSCRYGVRARSWNSSHAVH